MGIELELFTLAEVAVHYRCMVCKEIPEMATSALRVMCPSGHIICSTCIDTHSRPSKCYLCSHPIVKAGEWSRTMQPAIEHLIKDLEVRCTSEVVPTRFKEIADCIRVAEQPEGCLWKGKCVDLRTHEKLKCEHRIEHCKHFARGCQMADFPPKVQVHETVCEFRDVMCYRSRPWDGIACMTTHRFNDTAKHESQDCKYHACAYSKSGCRFGGKLAEIEAHQRSYCAPIHAKIAMLEKAIAEETLVTEKERINKAVAKQVSHLKKRISGLQQDLQTAENRLAVYKMQNAPGLPILTSQAVTMPGSSTEKNAGANIQIRTVTAPKAGTNWTFGNDESSEAAWKEFHWTEPDWKHVDFQAAKAATKRILAPLPQRQAHTLK